MSAKIDFDCNFCGRRLVDKSVNEEFKGFCIDPDEIPRGSVATNNLRVNIDGPHICLTCLSSICNANTVFEGT